MKFGLFSSAQANSNDLPPETGQGFRDYLDFNVEAEALGFQSSFLVEHHFTGWNQVSATLFCQGSTITAEPSRSVVVRMAVAISSIAPLRRTRPHACACRAGGVSRYSAVLRRAPKRSFSLNFRWTISLHSCKKVTDSPASDDPYLLGELSSARNTGTCAGGNGECRNSE
jgi:hypothetical protein